MAISITCEIMFWFCVILKRIYKEPTGDWNLFKVNEFEKKNKINCWWCPAGDESQFARYVYDNRLWFVENSPIRMLSRDLRNIKPSMHQSLIVNYHGRRKCIQIYHNRIYFINYVCVKYHMNALLLNRNMVWYI